MAISYATIQIVKCCSSNQSGLEDMGATVTALYGKKSYEGVVFSLGKPTDLLLELLFLSKAHINLDYPWTSLTTIALIKTIDNNL